MADSGTEHPASPSASVDRLAAFQEELRLVSCDPTTNRDRFYTLAWQPSLFGGPALVRTWGRLGTVGRSQTSFYPDQATARAAIIALLRRRLRHGYEVARWR